MTEACVTFYLFMRTMRSRSRRSCEIRGSSTRTYLILIHKIVIPQVASFWTSKWRSNSRLSSPYRFSLRGCLRQTKYSSFWDKLYFIVHSTEIGRDRAKSCWKLLSQHARSKMSNWLIVLQKSNLISRQPDDKNYQTFRFRIRPVGLPGWLAVWRDTLYMYEQRYIF